MLEQYYNEFIFRPGAPEFKDLPESYKTSLNKSANFGVWNLNRAAGEFACSFKELAKALGKIKLPKKYLKK
jgi:hypothetical protein